MAKAKQKDPVESKLARATAAPEGLTTSADDEGEGAPMPVIKRQERIYKSTQEVDHDLFKLEVATMRKNVSFTDKPHIEEFEHCHIYHTVDSSGKKQEASSPVGGHHHPITLVVDPSGVPTLKVGPPAKWVKKKIRGVMRRVSEPIWLEGAEGVEGERERDEHTHAVSYLGSERIKLRQPNVEFAKMESALKSMREPSIEGVKA